MGKKIRSHFAENGLKLILRDEKYWKGFDDRKKPDIFICHDSRDKEYVREIYKVLTKRWVKVWFDEYSLTIGDILTTKIEEGLQSCEYGMLIVSKNFLSNEKWAKIELESLKLRQMISKQKILLPIWLDVSEKEIIEFAPSLDKILALNSTIGINQIADKVARIVKFSKKN